MTDPPRQTTAIPTGFMTDDHPVYEMMNDHPVYDLNSPRGSKEFTDVTVNAVAILADMWKASSNDIRRLMELATTSDTLGVYRFAHISETISFALRHSLCTDVHDYLRQVWTARDPAVSVHRPPWDDDAVAFHSPLTGRGLVLGDDWCAAQHCDCGGECSPDCWMKVASVPTEGHSFSANRTPGRRHTSLLYMPYLRYEWRNPFTCSNCELTFTAHAVGSRKVQWIDNNGAVLKECAGARLNAATLERMNDSFFAHTTMQECGITLHSSNRTSPIISLTADQYQDLTTFLFDLGARGNPS